MLQYATYSVISPEGCASILWKTAEHAPEAAETLGITAPRLKQLGLIDKIVSEPLGGAHRDHAAMMVTLKKALTEALRQLQELPLDTLLEAREDRILALRQVQGDHRRLIRRPAPRGPRGAPMRPPPALRCRRAARCARRRACRARPRRTPPRVAVALSGGRDSVVLLDALAALAPALRLRACGRPRPPRAVAATPTRGRHSARRVRAARRAADRAARRGRARARAPSLEGGGARARATRRGRGARDADLRRARASCATTRRRRCCCSSCAARGRTASRRCRAARAGARGRRCCARCSRFPRAAIDAYAQRRGLALGRRRNNADTALRRNVLRHEMRRALRARFPAIRATLARAAAHQAEAARLADELAALDARRRARRAMPPARRSIATRSPGCRRAASRAEPAALVPAPAADCRAPSAARLAAMLAQLARRARRRARAARARRRRDRRPSRPHRRARAGRRRRSTLPWRGETTLALPHGTLEFAPAPGPGLDAARARAGADRRSSARRRRALRSSPAIGRARR